MALVTHKLILYGDTECKLEVYLTKKVCNLGLSVFGTISLGDTNNSLLKILDSSQDSNARRKHKHVQTATHLLKVRGTLGNSCRHRLAAIKPGQQPKLEL